MRFVAGICSTEEEHVVHVEHEHVAHIWNKIALLPVFKIAACPQVLNQQISCESSSFKI